VPNTLRWLSSILMVAASGCAPAGSPPGDPAAERAAVDSVLTSLHQFASRASWDRYFALFAPDAVFFGTDVTERWSVQQFRGYAAKSKGWTYLKTERNIFIAPDGRTAWFDERLQNANYGETRGTGVLVKGEAGWKISQYNLTIPIPNDLAREITTEIKEFQRGR
jgi:hypothetical protein